MRRAGSSGCRDGSGWGLGPLAGGVVREQQGDDGKFLVIQRLGWARGVEDGVRTVDDGGG